MAVTKTRIKELVEGLLEAGAVKSPPVPVERLIRHEGIQIVRKKLEDETSGFIYIDPKTSAAVIGLNVSHSMTRQRFTLAHELGHYMMHRGDGGHLHVDEKDFFVRFRDQRARGGWTQQEKEANAFAAALLMPTVFVMRDVRNLKEGVSVSDEKAVRSLATRYGVSLQAFLFRLANLNLLEQSFL